MRSAFVKGVALWLSTLTATFTCQAASAASYMFDFTNKGSYVGSSAGAVSGTAATAQTFSSTTTGAPLNVKVTAWHANDPNSKALTIDSISSATLGYWSGAGLGDLFGNDNGGDGTHQIDNVGGGADFLMFQFSQDVTLTSIGRNVYSMANAGVPCCDSQAQYWADTTRILGGPSSTGTVNLTPYSIAESTFSNIATNGQLNSTAAASTWLVSAAFNQVNDGFKISNLSVQTTGSVPAVPEPASWAMMILGMGVVGYAVRSAKRRSDEKFDAKIKRIAYGIV